MVLASVSNFTPDIIEAVNRFAPRGGVTKPIAKFKIMIIPKWTGLTPTKVTIGNKIGVKIMIAAHVSINVPTKSNKTLMSNSNNILFVVMLKIALEIIIGACVMANIRPKAVEIPIISKTGAPKATDLNRR